MHTSIVLLEASQSCCSWDSRILGHVLFQVFFQFVCIWHLTWPGLFFFYRMSDLDVFTVLSHFIHSNSNSNNSFLFNGAIKSNLVLSKDKGIIDSFRHSIRQSIGCLSDFHATILISFGSLSCRAAFSEVGAKRPAFQNPSKNTKKSIRFERSEQSKGETRQSFEE